MRKLLLLLIIVHFAALCAGSPQAFASSPDNVKTLAEDNNSFALALYRTLSSGQGNLFFSPYSISTALAMTWLGARGKTAQEMAKTLHFSLPGDTLNPAFSTLISAMNDKGKAASYELVVANRLWGQNGYRFLKSFLDGEKKYYGSDLELLDFKKNAEGARVTINKWVEHQTRDRIKDLIARGVLKEDTRLVLTNAIYFKSAWDETFSKGATGRAPFTVSSSKKVEADMMHKSDHLNYGRFDGLEILEIPYKSRELSMLVLLPRKADGLQEMMKALDPVALKEMLSKLAPCMVELSLPKFRTTSSFNLKETLTKMGMNTPFIFGAADFSGMDGTKLLYISEVIHKAFVDVHEEGTEAAAATAVVMAAGCAPPKGKPVIFTVDHPFFFIIRDNSTGSFLFMGRILNPKE